MPPMPLDVRPARPDDLAVPGLLYESAASYYDAFAGGPGAARRLLEDLYPRGRHTASWEICRVALLDGEVAGVAAAFAVSEGAALATRFLMLAAWRIGPRRWPGALRHLRASSRITPHPPEGALYVDALAVSAHARRRGVAQALLDDATQVARERALRCVALDTGLENAGAQALYAAAGFQRTGAREAADARAAAAIGGRGFVSFVRPL